MAIFASTTTSGYGDPLKALSIKALEQRMKDQQAQAAAQQPDASMMATIPGGIGSVLGIIGDKMTAARNENAAAEGRNELASVISQGPQGPDGQYSPQQMAVLARRSPEFMEKLSQNQHDLRFQGNQLRSTEGVATADRSSRENIATGDRTSREGIAKLQEEAATGRSTATNATNTGITSMTLAAKAQEGGLDRAATAEAQESKQDADTRMARLQAELAQSQKDRDNAFTSGQTDKVQAHDTRITQLKADLASGEARQSEKFQASQLATTIAKDEKLAGLERDLKREQLRATIAADSGNQQERLASEARQQELRLEHETRTGELKREHQSKLQTQAEKATSADVATKTGSDQQIEAAKLEAAKATQASDPKRNEAIRAAETDYRKALSHIDNLDEATKILQHPKGIYTGAAQNAAPIAGGIPGIGGMLVDKEKAQRTARFNTIVGEDAIRDMATTLKGSSTNYEMGEFKKMKNDPNISDEDRARQLQKVVKAARADLEAQRKETKTIGGDPDGIDKTMGRGASATGMSEADVAASIANAQAAVDSGKWTKEQANAKLKAAGVPKGL